MIAEAVAKAKEEEEVKTKKELEIKKAKIKIKQEHKARKEARARAKEEARSQAEMPGSSDESKEEEEAEQVAVHREPIQLGKPIAIAVIVLLFLVGVVLPYFPLGSYKEGAQQLMSERFGNKVTLGSFNFALLPTPRIKLRNTVIGESDAKIETITAKMSFGSIFGDTKVIDNLELEDVQIKPHALVHVPQWIRAKSSGQELQFSQVDFNNVRLMGQSAASINAQLYLEESGKFKSATLTDPGGNVTVEITPKDKGYQIDFSARDWLLPFGPKLDFDELRFKGTVRGKQLSINDVDGALFGGAFSAKILLNAGSGWLLDATFSGQQMELQPMASALSGELLAFGTLNMKGTLAARSKELVELFDNPSANITFTAENGALRNVDIERALKFPNKLGVRGGQTQFDQFSGALTWADARFQFKQLKLRSNTITAEGSIDVGPQKDLSGRIAAKVDSKSAPLKGVINVSGSLEEPNLKSGN